MREWACVLILVLAVSVSGAEQPDLVGRVVDSGENGIEGASVHISMAVVKVGTRPTYPGAYPDCRKSAVADADGRFTIDSLDPELRFYILAVAEGYVPALLDSVDPADGAIMFVLGKVPEYRLQPAHRVDGRVVDSDGKPVAGAKVDILGMKTERGSRYGALRDIGVDPLAVTNERGEFTVTSETTGVTFYAQISAPDFATQNIHTLSTGGAVHEVVLQRGVTVAGYAQDSGKGLPGVEIGMAPVNRSLYSFTGDHLVETSDNGSFEILNVPAQTEFYVYGTMQSLQGKGAVPARLVRTGDNGQRKELEALEVEPGFSIRGRVTLSEGGTIPPHTGLTISRDDASDRLFLTLDENGAFYATDLPAGEYGIDVRVRGYRMAKENYSLDPLNLNGLMGVIRSDIEGLTILLKPGKSNPNNSAPDASERYTKLRSKPIRGAE